MYLDKNKDELPKETETLFDTSEIPLIRHVFNLEESSSSNVSVGSGGESEAAASKRRLSVFNLENSSSSSSGPSQGSGVQGKAVGVGLQFKQQLTELMEKVYTTKPHYIR